MQSIKWLIIVTFLTTSLYSPSLFSAPKEGWLYVQRYLNKETIAEKGGIALTEVSVYDDQGMLIHSGVGDGSWSPGVPIPVPEGWYYVELGKYRTKWNLQKIFVKNKMTTIIETGWISVSTIARQEQPKVGCNSWKSEMVAFVEMNETEHLIMSNSKMGAEEFGMIQMPVGTYKIYWQGLPTTIEVKAQKIARIPTGFWGPSSGIRASLSVEKNEHAKNPTLELCQDGPTHLPAGTFWEKTIQRTDEYPFEKAVWNQVEITVHNDPSYQELKPEKLNMKIYKGKGNKAKLVSLEEIESLTNYGKILPKSEKTGGLKGLDSDIFGDPTDIQ